MRQLATILLLCCCLFFVSCDRTDSRQNTTIPDMASFSSGQYEHYSAQFPKVNTATLYYNESIEQIEPDDPRLIRLLNYIAYSKDQGLTVWMRGPLMDEEIRTCESANIPMLEIYFEQENAD